MDMNDLKELYVTKNEDADRAARTWSESLFGVNINGDSFWSIGIDYITELIKLLGITEKYDLLNIQGIKNILDNEDAINSMLDVTNSSKFLKLKEIMSLNDSVKIMIYDYIKGIIEKKEAKENMLNSINVSNSGAYTELNENSFSEDENGVYVAKNIALNNLKIEKIEILGERLTGLDTLKNIIEQYKDIDLKKICVEMLVNGGFSDWDENTNTFENCVKLLSDKCYMTVFDNEMDISFNTANSDSFGGHNPVLTLYSDKKNRSIGIE